MSDVFHIYCDDCRTCINAGSERVSGEWLVWADYARLGQFLKKHRGHRLFCETANGVDAILEPDRLDYIDEDDEAPETKKAAEREPGGQG